MVLCFTPQGDGETVYIETENAIDDETKQKIENMLQEIIETYSKQNNGDFYDFKIHDAIEEVMIELKIGFHEYVPEMVIIY